MTGTDRPMPSFALAAIGKDRPGIVATVARVLYERGCNIEDSSMTMLRGNFAIMLVLASPDGMVADDLDEALRPVCVELGLTFSVLAVEDRDTHPHPSHILTVYGADRPGILYRVSELLATAGVNITDLDSRLVGGEHNPVYALMLELALPPQKDVAHLRDDLQQVASKMDVDLTLRPLEDDLL